ncbi:MAG: GNAT family N-acetyltransferase [Spirochaetaceae bacterium]|nr:GNAT family N-acetyltransferase [Spirochaetaceae bacterium]
MEAQQIRIRQAVDSDARGIAQVHIDSWRSTYTGIVPAEHLAGLDYEEREARWHRILADERQTAFVAEDRDGRIIGFASGGPERSGAPPASGTASCTDDSQIASEGSEEATPEYSAELYAIYLFESGQRQGVGRRLVAALCSWFLARGWRSMLTWVLTDNPSRNFYEALGGAEVRVETITIGGTELTEVAYGWSDIVPLTTGP